MPIPMCEFCNTRHESYQAHVFPKTAAEVRNHIVTNMVKVPETVVTYTKCNQCVTKDEEILRLRNQLQETQSLLECAMEDAAKLRMGVKDSLAKRDRAAYMREYRKRGISRAS